jgi:LysM repeat protein
LLDAAPADPVLRDPDPSFCPLRHPAGETSMLRKTQVTSALLALGLAAAAAPAAVVAQKADMPESHTVKKGDTLWDLARYYMGDPFLWPQIYRLNTSVVEDPHWIYPGEVLRLSAGAGAVASVPSTDTPAPAPDSVQIPAPSSPDTVSAPVEAVASEAPEDQAPLFPTREGQSIRQTLRAYVDQPPHPLRRVEFYSSGFLTENQPLPFGRVIGPVLPSQIKSTGTHRVAILPYTTIAVDPPAGGSYGVGDSLLVALVEKDLDGSYGRVVRPTGVVRVTEINHGHTIAQVVGLFGEMQEGQVTLPVEKFSDPGAVQAVPVTNGVAAKVVGWPGRVDLKEAQSVLFIDKGRDDGVAPGDVFEVRRTPKRTSDGKVRIDDLMATIQIVHVRDHTATGKVVNVLSPDLPAGTEARQVAKLPS